MNEIYLNGNCPNCGSSFKPDMSFGNLHRCSGCKQWSVFVNGRINENVIYKIIPFQQDKEKLRQELVYEIGERYDKKSFKKLGELQVESIYLPVREIKSGPERELIAANMEHNSLHVDLLSDKKKSETVKCADYDKLLPLDLQQDFSESMIKDNSLVTLDVDIEKKQQDKAYDLPKFGFYKIIYLPLYRISFTKSDKKWYCLGLNDFPGLKKSIPYIKDPDSMELKYGCIGQLLIAFSILCGFIQCSNISSEGFGPFEYPVHLILQMIWGMIKGLFISAIIMGLLLLRDIRKKKKILNSISKFIK